jgi:hypothetical protein
MKHVFVGEGRVGQRAQELELLLLLLFGLGGVAVEQYKGAAGFGKLRGKQGELVFWGIAIFWIFLAELYIS